MATTVALDKPSIEEAKQAMSYPRIGAGIDRSVYRVPGSRWVYKYDDYRGGRTNVVEYETYLKHKDTLPDGVAFPEMHMVSDSIIAAEFIEDESDSIADPNSECDFGWCRCWVTNSPREDCWTNPWRDKIRSAEVMEDIHGGNVRINKGIIYIIDLGEHA